MAEDQPAAPTEAQIVEAFQTKRMVDGLWANEKTRDSMLNLVAEAYPNARIPEIEAKKVVAKAAEPFREELKSLREELASEREVSQKAREKDLATAAGLTEADLPEVEKLMTERKIGDYETAVTFYSKVAKPVATPRAMPALTFETGDVGKFFKDPARAAREAADKWLLENGKGPRR